MGCDLQRPRGEDLPPHGSRKKTARHRAGGLAQVRRRPGPRPQHQTGVRMNTHRYWRLLGRRPAREVDAELQMHFEMLVEDYVAQGMTFDAARRAATELVGDVSAARRDAIAIGNRKQRRETLAMTWHAFTQDT